MTNCQQCEHSCLLTMGKNAGKFLCLSPHKYSPRTIEGEHSGIEDCEAYIERKEEVNDEKKL